MTNDSISLVKQILQQLGIQTTNLPYINIQGQDPILPSPFLLGQSAAAILAAMGYCINELWYLKTNKYQTINIKVEEAAIAMLSHYYMRIIGAETPVLWDPMSGFYQTQDHRWIQLHCNFPNHRQGVVDFLGCTNDREAVEKAIQSWQAIALENELAERGLCAAMVRTPQEWQLHPQCQATANLPMIEIIKIGDSALKPLPKGKRPLSGIKVLDLTRVIAGPVCGKMFAEQGAAVMRVASPHLPFIPPLVIDTGFGKLSTYLDLNQQQDHETLINLICESDVFSQSYRPGGLAEKGFGPEEVAKLNPHIIYIELTAYSYRGPWKNRHGYDSLVQCVTGIVAEQSSMEKPKHLPAQALDYITGFLAATGAMAALKRRAIEGGSYLVRVSLEQTAAWLKSLNRVAINYQSCTTPTSAQIAHLLTRTNTPFGLVEHMLPILQLSETPPYWDKSAVPLGSHPAKWDIEI